MKRGFPAFSFWGILLFSSAILAGCSGSRRVQNMPAPAWVNARPLSSAFYVGIGSAPLQGDPSAALQAAKDRAASDLASEISVNVQSTSLLESAEAGGQVSEHFSSSISSLAQERITGFDVVDIWEGPGRIHVYYRLNKAQHAAERESRRQEAMAAAVSEYTVGREALESGQLLKAISHWSMGIMMLEEFWNEVNRTQLDGEEVNLESRLITEIRTAISNIDLQSSVEAVRLHAEGQFKFPLGLHATIQGKSMSGVPIRYGYHNGTYRKSGTEFTDDEGIVVAVISGVDPNRTDTDFHAEVDIDRLWKQAEVDPTVVALCGSPVSDQVRLPISVEMPAVYVGVDPNSGLAPSLHEAPMQALRSALLDEGFTLVDGAAEAAFGVLFNLRSELRTPTADLGNFHTAYIEGSITIRDADGNRVDEIRLDRTKGVQLNSDAAMRLALSNAAEIIEKSLGKSLAQRLR